MPKSKLNPEHSTPRLQPHQNLFPLCHATTYDRTFNQASILGSVQWQDYNLGFPPQLPQMMGQISMVGSILAHFTMGLWSRLQPECHRSSDIAGFYGGTQFSNYFSTPPYQDSGHCHSGILNVFGLLGFMTLVGEDILMSLLSMFTFSLILVLNIPGYKINLLLTEVWACTLFMTLYWRW